jgi:hypothetical protein
VKAREFLEQGGWTTGEVVDAGKVRQGREQALALARAADVVVAARGKKVLTFDMKQVPPDDDTLAAALLGPTGNLRAPTLRIGKTLLVGFGEAAYRQLLAP